MCSLRYSSNVCLTGTEILIFYLSLVWIYYCESQLNVNCLIHKSHLSDIWTVCQEKSILSNIWFDTNVTVRSLHARVTLGPNMLAHAHAKVKEQGVLVLGNSYMYIFWLSGPCFPSPCRKDPSLVLCSSCKAVKDCYWLRLLCRSIQKSIKDIRFFMCKAYICSEK